CCNCGAEQQERADEIASSNSHKFFLPSLIVGWLEVRRGPSPESERVPASFEPAERGVPMTMRIRLGAFPRRQRLKQPTLRPRCPHRHPFWMNGTTVAFDPL